MRTVFKTALAAAMILPAPALADDAKPPFTVEQCVTILNGLNSLNWAGQQLNDQGRPADAKQYKLGDARFTISEDIQALTGVLTTYQRAQQQFMAELPTIPTVDQNKPVPPEVQQMQADQNKRAIANQIAMLARPCNVTPGRLKLGELKLGDGPDQNAIPPGVLAAFSLIVDK